MTTGSTLATRRAGRSSVVLTHSSDSLPGLSSRLAYHGYSVSHAPLIEIVPRLDRATRRKIEALAAAPWLLFTSRNTVRALRSLDFEFAGTSALFGAVGPGTAGELNTAGATVALTSELHDASSLATAFLRHENAAGPVGLPCGNLARPTLEAALTNAGLAVQRVVVYDTVPRQVTDLEGDVIVLSSPSAVDALPEASSRRAQLVAIGPTTAHAIAARGWSCTAARAATAEAIVDAVLEVTAP